MGRVFSYDILANPTYAWRFLYIHANEKGRLSYIASPNHDFNFERIAERGMAKKTEKIYSHDNKESVMMAMSQSDYVRLVLEMAYMTEHQALTTEFTARSLCKRINKLRQLEKSQVSLPIHKND
jgi:hypothetical protein